MSVMRYCMPGSKRETLRLIAAGAAVTFSCWMGLVILRPGDQFSAIWPANGVLLAFVVTARRRDWAKYLGVGFCVNVATHWYVGFLAAPVVPLAFADSAEILIAALAFWKTAPQRPDLADIPTLIRFTVFAGFLGPLGSSLWVLCATNHFNAASSISAQFRCWFIADSLSVLLFTPLILAFLDPELVKLFSLRRLVETLSLLLLLSGAAILVFRNAEFPFPFFLLVALIPLIFRLGPSGGAIGILAIACPATHYTFAGRGPLARLDLFYWSFFLQVYFLVLVVMVYVLSAVLAKENKLTEELRASETRYRILAETSQDMILRTTVAGARTYVSPSIVQVTGWKEEELPPADNAQILVHPGDREKYSSFLSQLPDQAGRRTLVYRSRRRDGQYGWLEAYVGTVFNRNAEASELVWTVRDISLRIAHEDLLKAEKQRAEELASTDGLTGLRNRRGFDERLSAVWISAGQRQASISLLLLDVDHFKSYNDDYGHQSGDECLRQIARVIGECVRQPEELAARYGGEEFAVILPHAGIVRAREVGERIREKVEQLGLAHARSPSGKVTLSAGVATVRHADHLEVGALVATADEALYAAKREGRNRVVLAS